MKPTILKLIILISIVSLITLINTNVFADSPLTSTPIYEAYVDVDIVKAAQDTGKMNKEFAKYLAEDNPIDIKAAVINALANNTNSTYQENLNTYINNSEEYSIIRYDRLPDEININELSGDELFCLGYLMVNDFDYNGVVLLEKAKEKISNSLTVSIIYIVAKSQACNKGYEVWDMTSNIIEDKMLKQDMRKAAIKIIADYQSLYKGDTNRYELIAQYEKDNASEFKKICNNTTLLFVNSPKAYINNVETQIDKDNNKVTPLIKDNRTLIPVRFISESLGATVSWDEVTSTATINLNNKIVKMTIESKKIKVNNIESEIDVPAQIIQERTFIPLRALVEALGKKVFWNDRGLIIISDNDNIINTKTEKDILESIVSRYISDLPPRIEPKHTFDLYTDDASEKLWSEIFAYELFRNYKKDKTLFIKELCNYNDDVKNRIIYLLSTKLVLNYPSIEIDELSEMKNKNQLGEKENYVIDKMVESINGLKDSKIYDSTKPFSILCGDLGLDAEKKSKLFNAERVKLGDRFESELDKFLGNDIERHYWCALFVAEPYYLRGNKPLYDLYYKITDEGIELCKVNSDFYLYSHIIAFNVNAAIVSQKIGQKNKAVEYKKNAEYFSGNKDFDGCWPAHTKEEFEMYDEIPFSAQLETNQTNNISTQIYKILEPIVSNLSDDKTINLRVCVQLIITNDADGNKILQTLKSDDRLAIATIISFLRKETKEQVIQPDASIKIGDGIVAELNKAYKTDKFVRVTFKEFIVQ